MWNCFLTGASKADLLDIGIPDEKNTMDTGGSGCTGCSCDSREKGILLSLYSRRVKVVSEFQDSSLRGPVAFRQKVINLLLRPLSFILHQFPK